VDEVIELMSECRVRRIPVTEDNGRLVGLITQTDIGLRLGPIRPYKVEQLIERISQHGYARR
jgi:CBS-domain-containing membrane protein